MYIFTIFIEYVLEKRIDSVEVSDLKVEISKIDYGFNIQGILGIDFFIDLSKLLHYRAFGVRYGTPNYTLQWLLF